MTLLFKDSSHQVFTCFQMIYKVKNHLFFLDYKIVKHSYHQYINHFYSIFAAMSV
jgi:hypothetical protein